MKEKTQTSLRKFLREKFDSSDFYPSNHFINNLDKILNNKIEILNNISKKENTPEESNIIKSNFWLLKPQYAVGFVLSLFLILTIGFTAFNIQNTNGSKSNLSAAEVLQKVDQKLTEIQSSNQVLHYKVNQISYNLSASNETNLQPTYCERWIDYSNSIQRSTCGVNINGFELPIEQKVSTNNEVLKNPEFSLKFYSENLGINFDNAKIINESDPAKVYIETEIALTESLKLNFPNLLDYEFNSKNISNNAIIGLTVDNTKSEITNADISFQFENGSNLKAYHYDINVLNDTDTFSSSFFDPIENFKPQSYNYALKDTDVSYKLNNDKSKYIFSFNAKKDINYLVFSKSFSQDALLIKNIVDIKDDQQIKLEADTYNQDNVIYIVPYTIVNNYFLAPGVYSFGYEFRQGNSTYSNRFYVMNFQTLNDIFNIDFSQITKLTYEQKILSSREYEDSVSKFAIPNDWKITNLDCDQKDCNSITLEKGKFKFTYYSIDNTNSSSIVPNNANYSSCYTQSVRKNERVTSDLYRINSYFDPSLPKDKNYTCIYANQANSSQLWLGSTFSNAKPPYNYLYIELPHDNLQSSSIYLSQKYGVSIQYQYTNAAENSALQINDPELIQGLKEMDAIVKSIEFKK